MLIKSILVLLRNPFFLLLIVTFLRLESACSSSSSHCAASLAWAEGPMALSYDTCSPRLLGWPLYLGETLPLWNLKDKKCCFFETPYVAAPMRVLGDVIARTLTYARLCTDVTTRTRLFLVHERFVSEEIHLFQGDSYVFFYEEIY